MSNFLVGLDLGLRQDPTALCVIEKRMVDARTGVEPPPEEFQQRGAYVYPGTTAAPDIIPAQEAKKARLDPKMVSRYDCSLLQRFPIQEVSYPEQVERVCALFCENPELEGAALCVDWTGVGLAVVDYFKKAKVDPVRCPRCLGTGTKENGPCLTCVGDGKIKLKAKLRPVYITAGSKWTVDGDGFRVAKQELVGVVQVLMQANPSRLVIDSRLRLAKFAAEECRNFQYKVTAAGNTVFGPEWRTDHTNDDLVLCLATALWVGERMSRKFWVA
jgi:hypothetical protein